MIETVKKMEMKSVAQHNHENIIDLMLMETLNANTKDLLQTDIIDNRMEIMK